MREREIEDVAELDRWEQKGERFRERMVSKIQKRIRRVVIEAGGY